MSEPPNTLGTTTVETHQDHKKQLQYLPVIHGGTTSSSTSQPRQYRKGNWTIQETLVLITAKKLDEERRIKASSTPSSSSSCGGRTGGELRWKWVENYCWNNGCLRSQNQCNDKWDNLLRDYKKVREHELRSSQSDGDGDGDGSDQVPSYWAIDRQERKDRNLPSNMAAEVYEALKDVVQKRYPQRTTPTQPPHCTATPLIVHPPPPPPAVAPPPVSETSDSSETDWSGKSNLDTKRRRVRDIGSSIIRSASVLARTLKSCEEKKEKRHRQMMELEERRLQVKETRNEMNRQGLAGLVAALNNLSGAMHSLISDRPEHT